MLDSMILWRYIDFNKLVTLIKGDLFLSRADSFEDNSECTTFFDSNILSCDKTLKNLNKNKFLNEEINQEEKYKKFNKQGKKLNSRNTFLNCWFIGEAESFLMWKAYTNCHTGFLIKVNAKDLIQHLIDNNKRGKRKVNYGKTFYTPCPFSDNSERYINSITMNTDNIENHIFEKYDFFVGENEFRFVIENTSKNINNRIKSMKLKIDLLKIDSLEIFAHPKMFDWEFENLKLIFSKFRIDKKLYKSKIILNA